MRKHQQTLMLIVTVIIIIAFTWLYNSTQFDRIGTERVGTMYGREVTMARFTSAGRKFELSRALSLFEMMRTLGGQARSESEFVDNFIWNGMVLRYEAGRLGISVSDEEVIEAVQNLPAFQTNGVYDSNKYNNFIANVLGSRGMTPDQIEELLRDSLRLEKMKALVGSTIAAAPAEVRTAYEFRNRQTELSVVRLKLEDFTKAVQLSEDDLKKAFEERKDALNTDEQRKVRYVAFTLPKTEKPLAGKERVGEMQKLADVANEVAVAMTEKDAKLEEVAKKFGVEVKEAPPFPLDAPPEELDKSDEVARTTFERLSKDEPNSDVVLTENGYYVLQLADVIPARPLTFEEAKPKLTEQLTQERSQEAMNLKAAEFRTKIDAELKAGKTFADAAAAAGATAEKLPPFSMAEPAKLDSPDARIIMGRSLDLAEGQLSEPTPSPGGMILVHVDKRLPVDEAKFEQEKTVIAESVLRSKRDAAFAQWLKERRTAANIVTAHSDVTAEG